MSLTTTAPTRTAAPPAAAPRRRAGRKAGTPYAFLAPALILFTAFLAAPIVYAGYLSLRKVKVSGLGLGAKSRTEIWAGFENYARSLSDPDFLPSVYRVGAYGLIVVPAMLGLALLFALLLDANRTRESIGKFARISIFLPYAVPAVVASLLWGFLYLPRVSPINDAIEALGFTAPNLLSTDLTLWAVANIAVWGGTGFNMIVIYTALRAVPTSLYESARIDGASELAIAWRIKIPIVMPSLVMTFVFSLIATLQVFAEPMTLRPLANTISTTWTPLMKVYRDAFARNDLYAAAATSVIIALATFILSFGFLKLVGRRAFNQED
ncbi:carbohydrate ABC transporter permease [Actinoplanes xinjiangensis]|jgi:multiple sugar transport system permease protein|uniref:Carbohydrate ABC transporter membrane protein 1 (CUT1 family) n=1 Tax=Actinoplanes xinjiangensis TaxID=512350 RepID=A0A316FUV0_9ACTN|nr:sugar ABC transporter permease [Actinoplanes xinjiangensis]PWK52564.1 carbohydrate ABC transporter membrane protein 1 (CUT1 family) [Actinoplanes xinjiangensis]GIF36737.1 ABC transporter permease [Actinoplanes xinjiangensis]